MLAVGDKVNYVPAEAHAMQRRNGELAFALGWRAQQEIRHPNGKVATPERIVPLVTNDEIEEKLRFIRNHPQGETVRRDHLVLLHPVNTWPAVVRAIHTEAEEQGDRHRVDLDIDCGGGGTLHYDGVEVDDDKSVHTCHMTKADPSPVVKE